MTATHTITRTPQCDCRQGRGAVCHCAGATSAPPAWLRWAALAMLALTLAAVLPGCGGGDATDDEVAEADAAVATAQQMTAMPVGNDRAKAN